MTNDVVSILLVGDSHVLGYKEQNFSVKLTPSDSTLTVLLKRAWLDGAYAALDIIVTFPDGRIDLNPMLHNALRVWPGLNVKGRPLVPGTNVQKQLVVSLGTSLSGYDPAFEFSDRAADRLLFRDDVDFVLPERPDLDIDLSCTIVPISLMREMYSVILEPLRKAIELLARDHHGRLWLVGSPPPPRDNVAKEKLIAARTQTNGGFPNPMSLPSPTVALKAWLLVTGLVRDLCEGTACKFIDCAQIACDQTGFLKPEFVHDGVHGNEQYNELMARHIVSTVLTYGMGLSSQSSLDRQNQPAGSNP